MGALAEMLQIYSHPQTEGTTHLGWTRGQWRWCLLWYLSEHSRAGAKQQHQTREVTSGSHTKAEGAPGWAVPVGSWLGCGTQPGGSPWHTEPVFALCIWGETWCPRDRQDPAPKLLSQTLVWHHHAGYGLNWPKASPRMDYSNFPALPHLVATWAWRIPVPCLS